jgi:hypothetical protein
MRSRLAAGRRAITAEQRGPAWVTADGVRARRARYARGRRRAAQASGTACDLPEQAIVLLGAAN